MVVAPTSWRALVLGALRSFGRRQRAGLGLVPDPWLAGGRWGSVCFLLAVLGRLTVVSMACSTWLASCRPDWLCRRQLPEVFPPLPASDDSGAPACERLPSTAAASSKRSLRY